MSAGRVERIGVAVAALAAFAPPVALTASAAVDEVHPFHTSAVFDEVDHFGATLNRGRIPAKQGRIEFDRKARTGRVDITLDMTRLQTGIGLFETRLKSADVFDVENHPTAHFVSHTLSFDGERLAEVGGSLTMRVKTQAIFFKATVFNCCQGPVLKTALCGGEFTTVIQPSLFGVSCALDLGAADDVRLTVLAEAVLKSAWPKNTCGSTWPGASGQALLLGAAPPGRGDGIGQGFFAASSSFGHGSACSMRIFDSVGRQVHADSAAPVAFGIMKQQVVSAHSPSSPRTTP